MVKVPTWVENALFESLRFSHIHKCQFTIHVHVQCTCTFVNKVLLTLISGGQETMFLIPPPCTANV